MTTEETFKITCPVTGKAWHATVDQVFQLRQNGLVRGLTFEYTGPSEADYMAISMGLRRWL